MKKNQDEEAVQPHETARQPDCWEVSVLYTDYFECFYSDSCKNCTLKLGVSLRASRTEVHSERKVINYRSCILFSIDLTL